MFYWKQTDNTRNSSPFFIISLIYWGQCIVDFVRVVR